MDNKKLTEEQRLYLSAAEFTVALFETNKVILGLKNEKITVIDVLNASLLEAEAEENYEICEKIKELIDILNLK
jgi:hypothetical protein